MSFCFRYKPSGTAIRLNCTESLTILLMENAMNQIALRLLMTLELMSYRFHFRFGLVMVISVLLWGCGKPAPENSAAAVSATTDLPQPPMLSNCEPGKPGGRLVISTFVDPKTFNPIIANEASSVDVIRLLFASLVDYDYTQQEPQPSLAESWTVEPDQKTWTFKLRKGLKWSDGHPLTAEDVVFTWQVIYDPKIDNVMADTFRVDGQDFKVTQLDELTIRAVAPSIYAPFLIYFGGMQLIPKHILQHAVASTNFMSAYGINVGAKDFVGSGPFRLKDYKPAQHVLLERNPYFHGVDKKGQRLPYLDNIIFTIVPDMNAMTLRFLSGETDVFEYIRPDEFSRFETEAKKGKFQLHDLGPGLERSFLTFNLNVGVNEKTGKPYLDPKKQKWFRNTKFRQAIAHAVDRNTIIRNILGGRAVPAYGFVSAANQKWLNTNLVEYPFDLNRSRALLKEIGIEDRNGDGKLEDAEGTKIEFSLSTIAGNPLRENISILLVSDLNKLGLEVTKRTVDFNKLSDTLRVSRDFDLALLGLGGGDTDPSSGMNVLKSDGFTHYWAVRQAKPSMDWEARIDTLMNDQLKSIDFAVRKKAYDEVQEILNREQPFIYTVGVLNAAACRSDLANVRPTVLTTYRVSWNAEELFFRR